MDTNSILLRHYKIMKGHISVEDFTKDFRSTLELGSEAHNGDAAAAYKDVQGRPGQISVLRQIKEQELRLRFNDFGANDAFDIGQKIRHRILEVESGGASSASSAASQAKSNKCLLEKTDAKPVVIDIRVGDLCLFHCATPGATLDNEIWVERKRRTTTRFGMSSYGVGRDLAAQETTLAQKYNIDESQHAAHGGCFPILLKSGLMIGTITVSGLAQVWDHIVITEAIEQHLMVRGEVKK